MKIKLLSAAALVFGSQAVAETVDSAIASISNPVWQPYHGAQINFDVLRKGKPFGTHRVAFEKNENGDLKVTTDVDLKVKVGPFTAFQYELDATEFWRDDALVSLKGTTNDDGQKQSVSAALTEDGLSVKGTGFEGLVASTIIPSSHWNMEQVRSTKMLSTEDGSVLDMQIIPKGREVISVAGNSIAANRFLLDSDIDIDLWYDDFGRWLKLTFEARGQTIEYRLTELY